MKRTPSGACFLCLLCLLAGCGSGRVRVERHLVFVRGTAPENAVVWIADADGGHARRLVRGLTPVVSPDGRTVAIGRTDGIHLVSSDGKRDHHLTSAVLNPQAWSPDGKRLVAGVAKLAVVDVDSGGVRVLAHGAFYGFGLSPDGRRLIYARAPRESPVQCGLLFQAPDRDPERTLDLLALLCEQRLGAPRMADPAAIADQIAIA